MTASSFKCFWQQYFMSSEWENMSRVSKCVYSDLVSGSPLSQFCSSAPSLSCSSSCSSTSYHSFEFGLKVGGAASSLSVTLNPWHICPHFIYHILQYLIVETIEQLFISGISLFFLLIWINILHHYFVSRGSQERERHEDFLGWVWELADADTDFR